MKYTKYYISY